MQRTVARTEHTVFALFAGPRLYCRFGSELLVDVEVTAGRASSGGGTYAVGSSTGVGSALVNTSAAAASVNGLCADCSTTRQVLRGEKWGQSCLHK